MKNFVQSVVVLFAIAAVTVATSTNEGRNVPVARAYTVASDCSNASMTSGSITAVDNNITTPLNTTYLNIGLPVSSLIIGGETSVSGTIAPSLVRTCNLSTATVGVNVKYIYTCDDNGIYACTASFTETP